MNETESTNSIFNYNNFLLNQKQVAESKQEDILMTYAEARVHFIALKGDFDRALEKDLAIFTCFKIAHFIDDLVFGELRSIIMARMFMEETTICHTKSFICGYYRTTKNHNLIINRPESPQYQDMDDEKYIETIKKARAQYRQTDEKRPFDDCVIDRLEINLDKFFEARQDYRGVCHNPHDMVLPNVKVEDFYFAVIKRTLEEVNMEYFENPNVISIEEYKKKCLSDLEELKSDIKMAEYNMVKKNRDRFFKKISNVKIQHLDKGYVKIIESMGDDVFAARFARSSYDKTDRIDMKADRGLISRLVEDRHTSPIESCRLAFEIKTCLMVRDQHVRHRMSSINIQSLRYTKHDGDYYLPPVKRIKIQSKTNKQGSGSSMSEEDSNKIINDLMKKPLEESYKYYEEMTNMGLTRELARGILGTFFYTKISWTIDIHNLMNFLKLRNSEEAQEEIRELAQIIELYFEYLYPYLFEAYNEFIKNSVTFSRKEMCKVKSIIGELLCLNYELRAMAEKTTYYKDMKRSEYYKETIFNMLRGIDGYLDKEGKPSAKMKKFAKKIGFEF